MIISSPIYGDTRITEPVLLALIATPAMQRLKGIDQNVTPSLIPVPWKPFSRFDHCVGAMHVIKLMGGDLEEQIAGLLHDVSHTAFSHAMDFVFDSAHTQDFHEKHLDRIVRQSGIPAILSRHSFDLDRILDHKNFSLLEQELPALCADRIDYALETFYSRDVASKKQVSDFTNHLAAKNGKIVFTDQVLAKRFALQFMDAENAIWGGSAISNLAYMVFAKIVKGAYERGRVKLDDFFTTDREFLDKFDDQAKGEMEKLRQIKFAVVTKDEPYDYHTSAKIRYVDPAVLQNGEVKNLSEIDTEFSEELKRFLIKRKVGNYVKILA